MTAFRPLDPFQVYTDLTGKLAAGGNLHFYTAGTTTDANVYGDEALTVNNGPIIAIGTDGRAVDDIWADGTLSYRCRIYASDGTLIRDRDNISLPGSGSAALPAMVAGEFLTTDGSNWLMAAIRQALDPTGAANKVMGSDGTNLLWVDKPTNGTNGAAGANANVTVTANSFKANNGAGSFWYVQAGSGSAAPNGTKNTQASITFPVAFSTTPYVIVMPSTAVSGGIFPIPMNYSVSTTGFTVYLGCNDDNGTATFTATTNFTWIAFGTTAT